MQAKAYKSNSCASASECNNVGTLRPTSAGIACSNDPAPSSIKAIGLHSYPASADYTNAPHGCLAAPFGRMPVISYGIALRCGCWPQYSLATITQESSAFVEHLTGWITLLAEHRGVLFHTASSSSCFSVPRGPCGGRGGKETGTGSHIEQHGL